MSNDVFLRNSIGGNDVELAPSSAVSSPLTLNAAIADVDDVAVAIVSLVLTLNAAIADVDDVAVASHSSALTLNAAIADVDDVLAGTATVRLAEPVHGGGYWPPTKAQPLPVRTAELSLTDADDTLFAHGMVLARARAVVADTHDILVAKMGALVGVAAKMRQDGDDRVSARAATGISDDEILLVLMAA